MALTPEQIKIIEDSKKRGLTREQTMARVFMPTVQAKDTGRFAGAGKDIAQAGKSLWQDYRARSSNLIDAGVAQYNLEQSIPETAMQFTGQILGGVGDTAFRGLQALTTPFLKENEEKAIAEGVQNVVESTGIPQAISEMSPRTQRNISGAFGILEGLTAGTANVATSPATSGLRQTLSRFNPFSRTTQPAVAAPKAKTAEQIGESYVNRLRSQVNQADLDPRAREEAAQASLTFKEKWIGLRPDEKKRLQEMGEAKITEYLDATHLRNISDTPTSNSTLPPNVWGPQELGNYYVTDAFNKLETQLNSTGSEIGKTRAKLATVKLQQPQVAVIESTFRGQVEALGLSIKNGRIVEMPNKIAKTSGNDIPALQSLYDDMLKFKQSPTIENAYALRTNFDAKIKFGQSARDVSNAVDPVSRSVRSAIAGESAKVIGKSNAEELQKYSNFMDAYGELKSFTDRTAGSEYLLRLVMSGRGREARDLVDTIKQYTGIDLMNDATAMKIAIERFANESQQNLFKQEITRAGFDIAGLFKEGPAGIVGTVAQRLAEYGIDPEDVIKAAAAGTGGYILMTYYGEDGLTPAGLAVLAAMPDNARKQAIKQAQNIAKTTGKNVDDLAKYADEAPKLDTPSFNTGATPQTTALLEEAKKYKSAEEFVRAQGTPVYHGTATAFDSFDANKRTMSQGESSPEGFFFSTDKKEASIYAKEAAFKQGKKDGDVMEVYLSYDNPLILPSGKRTTKASNIRLAKENGHDAVIDEAGNIVVFAESQIQTKKQLEDIWKQVNQ